MRKTNSLNKKNTTKKENKTLIAFKKHDEIQLNK